MVESNSNRPKAFLLVDPNDPKRLIPTDLARGPWDPEGAHGGVGAAALVRGLEGLSPEKRLSRLTVDLTRPVPMAGFRVECELTRDGRSVATAIGRLLDDAGNVRLTATALYTGGTSLGPVPTVQFDPPSDPEHDEDAEFPIRRIVGHNLPNFQTAMRVRYPRGHDGEPGPTTVWIKTVDLLYGEETSPWQRAAIVGDCPNGFGRNAEPWEVNFINPDLTIHLHRQPSGKWLGLKIDSRWESDGHGIADGLMFDREGAVGRVVQTLLLRPGIDRNAATPGTVPNSQTAS